MPPNLSPSGQVKQRYELLGGLKVVTYDNGNVHISTPAGGVTWVPTYVNTVAKQLGSFLYDLRRKQ